MKPKVFISHKSEDVNRTEEVKTKCRHAGLEYYVDNEDSSVNGDRPDLIEYIARQIKDSHGVIVVASKVTQLSWWVPCEAGIGYENDMPLTAWTGDQIRREFELPSYLERVRSHRYNDMFNKWVDVVKTRARAAEGLSAKEFNINMTQGLASASRYRPLREYDFKYYYWFR